MSQWPLRMELGRIHFMLELLGIKQLLYPFLSTSTYERTMSTSQITNMASMSCSLQMSIRKFNSKNFNCWKEHMQNYLHMKGHINLMKHMATPAVTEPEEWTKLYRVAGAIIQTHSQSQCTTQCNHVLQHTNFGRHYQIHSTRKRKLLWRFILYGASLQPRDFVPANLNACESIISQLWTQGKQNAKKPGTLCEAC